MNDREGFKTAKYDRSWNLFLFKWSIFFKERQHNHRRTAWNKMIKEVEGKEVSKSIAIIMRTPGNDFELACGFLLSEGIIKGKDDILSISYIEEGNIANVVGVKIEERNRFQFFRSEKEFLCKL